MKALKISVFKNFSPKLSFDISSSVQEKVLVFLKTFVCNDFEIPTDSEFSLYKTVMIGVPQSEKHNFIMMPAFYKLLLYLVMNS